MSASITLSRNVDAIQIPSGNHTDLSAGTEVLITQQLGDSFTVYATNQAGSFASRARTPMHWGAKCKRQVQPTVHSAWRKVWEQLRECYDPEIPVNIVDLGLVYAVDVENDDSGKGQRVNVKMTLTAPGCGMGPTLARDAEQRLMTVPGVASANVELVWDPPWSPELISQLGRKAWDGVRPVSVRTQRRRACRWTQRSRILARLV
jgi:probable FeS assembly SUF system protein SufT